jgi:hypothetical protein
MVLAVPCLNHEVVLWIFPRGDTASRLTTPLFINRISAPFTLEGELLRPVQYLQPQTGE